MLNINTSIRPKPRYYTQFKQDVVAEKYVKFSITRSQRSLLAELRMGILPLHIETGCHYRKPLQESVCLYCSDNAMEDEYHVTSCIESFKTAYPDFYSWNLNKKFLAFLCHLIQTILLNLLRKYGIYEKHCFKLSILIFGFSTLNMTYFLDCNCVFVIITFFILSYFVINS